MDIIRNFLAVLFSVTAFLAPMDMSGQVSSSPLRLTTVVIDPGHGGKDAGCISPSGKTMEKTVVLDIATRLADKIRAGYPEVKVVMTRDDDTFVELQGRADIANKAKANLFISIHVNSVDGKKTGPHGYSVHILGQYTSKKKDLYAGNMDVVRRENSVIMLEDDYSTKYEGFDPSDPESYIFMNLMQNAFLEQSLKFARYVDEEMKGGAINYSRGISQDPFYVLWRTAMPAVLVECGFMSNPTDREALITSKGKEKIASDLYDAFRRYKKEYDGVSPVTPQPVTPPAPPAEPEKVSEPEPEPEPQPEANAGDKNVTAPETTVEPVTENPTVTEAAPVNEEWKDVVVFGTQVLATTKEMKADAPFFQGHPFKVYVAGNILRYILGCSSDEEEARKEFSTLKVSYPDAFLVKIENGVFSRARQPISGSN